MRATLKNCLRALECKEKLNPLWETVVQYGIDDNLVGTNWAELETEAMYTKILQQTIKLNTNHSAQRLI